LPNPLPDIDMSLTKLEALKALENERRLELFTEWGHRWFDLKRSPGFVNASRTRADEILTIVKGNNWQATDQLYPIPMEEINRNPNLRGHQNPGY
jgi:hypothetical protein